MVHVHAPSKQGPSWQTRALFSNLPSNAAGKCEGPQCAHTQRWPWNCLLFSWVTRQQGWLAPDLWQSAEPGTRETDARSECSQLIPCQPRIFLRDRKRLFDIEERRFIQLPETQQALIALMVDEAAKSSQSLAPGPMRLYAFMFASTVWMGKDRKPLKICCFSKIVIFIT